MSLYHLYSLYKQGSDPFFRKLETILENDLKNKQFKLEVEEITPMINAMALKKCMNENLWRPILNDLDDSIRLGSVNNVQIFYLIRSL